MTWKLFSNVTELDTPDLDTNFANLAAKVVFPCTVSGTNALALTTAAGDPPVTAYSSRAPIFSFVASGASTGSVTASVNGIGFKNVYKNNGLTQAGNGDIQSGGIYYLAGDASLNGGLGGFIILNPSTGGAAAGSIQGAFKNLVLQTTSNTAGTVTADALSVSDGVSNFTSLLSVNVSNNSATSGAGGLDTGSLSASTWYAVYVIYNPTTLTVNSLISTNFTAPLLPTGFTQYARVGSWGQDASKHWLRTIQRARRVRYVVGTNPTTLPVIRSGSHGSVTAPTFDSNTVQGSSTLATNSSADGSSVPTTASLIDLVLSAPNGAVSAVGMVAPNANYGPFSSTTNPPPMVAVSGPNASSNTNVNMMGTLALETTTIQYAANNANIFLYCAGFEDNL